MLGFAAYRTFSALEKQVAWVDRTNEVLYDVEGVISAMKDAETGERGYLLTGKDVYLEPYHTALESVPRYLLELSRLTHDNPLQEARVDTLRLRCATLLNTLSDNIATRRVGKQANWEEEIDYGKDKARMDRIRILVGEIRQEEQRLLNQRSEALGWLVEFTQGFIYIMVITSVVLAGAFLYFFRKRGREQTEHQRELQELNQELVTTNEELRASNEEMASNNEELSTVVESLERAKRQIEEYSSRELLRGRNLFELILTNFPSEVVIFDHQLKLEFINPRGLATLGKPMDAVLGKTPNELYEASHRDLFLPTFYKALYTQEPQQVEYSYGPVDKVKAFLATFLPLRNTQEREVQQVVAIFYDITERKQNEEVARSNSERVSSILEGMGDAFLSLDKDWNIQQVNQPFETLMHAGRGELIGKSLFDAFPLDRIPELTLAEYQLVMQERKPRHFTDFMKSLGFWGEVSAYPASGGGISIFIRDITERKEAELALQKSLSEKEILLAEIHHRVKNNLAIVSGLLQLQADTETAPELVQALQESRNRIYAITLIHEKLYQNETLSRIQFSAYVPDLVGSIQSIYRSSAQDIKLEMDVQEIILDITNAVPFALIINELLTNTYKHAFPKLKDGLIRITLKREEGKVVLEICDNGMGLPATFDIKQTTGLGMKLIRGLTGQLRGYLHISASPLAAPGRPGACFTMEFTPKVVEAVVL